MEKDYFTVRPVHLINVQQINNYSKRLPLHIVDLLACYTQLEIVHLWTKLCQFSVLWVFFHSAFIADV